MKFRLDTNGKVCFVVKYEKWEWDNLKDILHNKLHLKQKTITNGWGRDYKIKAFVEDNLQFKRYIDNTILISTTYDNLNDTLSNNQRYNVAIFRIVPDKNLEVSIPLDKFMTASEIIGLIDVLKSVYRILFELTLETEISIEIKEKTG